MTVMVRFPGGRVEHILGPDAKTTVCGKDAKSAAKFKNSERGSDSKVRPVCDGCKVEKTCTCGAVNYPSCLCNLTPAEWARTGKSF